jgi:hypothetical protein
MGVLPLQFETAESAASLGLDGREAYSIEGLGSLAPRQRLTVVARRDDGAERRVGGVARLDGQFEGVAEGLFDVFLVDQIVKRLRTVFAGDDLVHGRPRTFAIEGCGGAGG